MAKLGFDLCDLDLWPLTLNFCMDITFFVIGNHPWKFHDDTMMGTLWKRCDGRTDISQYEQTHNMMQVWTGKLSELQLPVQNPAREGACTSMSYKDRCVESRRISAPFITSPKFPSFSSNISQVIESLMNLENHEEMFLEPSACMDIPSSDGRLSVWTNPQHDASLDG